ncbi:MULTISPECIES: GntR family transcriptional regulator [Thermocrispum]|uniref:GntR family transcriptional regulator n=2 Tax=Thermocrispum agreste TaxID=37925 RepID=A0ABD6FJ61_9PSEU|nr:MULTISPECIES: GntR family transcriptional regulator [Thermocrispum]
MTEAETKAAKQSKSQRAYQWIKERIANHQFTPGYRLVLGTIAAELGMSVVPVREAIRQLEAEGLVTFERNVGAHVAMLDEDRYSASMQALSLIEAAAVALAAPTLKPDDLRRAREVNDHMREILDPPLGFDPHAFTVLNQKFHAILYRACPNRRLIELIEAEWARLGNMRDSIFAFVPDRARESVREHDALLDLIERRAPAHEIEHAMRRHRAGTLQALLSHTHPDQPVRLPDL